MKILVVYYSMYGNTFELANHVVEGAKAVEGAEVVLKQVMDLLPQSVIENDPDIKAAKEKQKHIPFAAPNELADYDAIIWGSPTRYGNVCSQLRNFIDQTGSLWLGGKLENKITGIFVSTSTLHFGQETTPMSLIPTLLHFGMIIVGVPSSVPELLSAKAGGTPYGPSHVTWGAPTSPITAEEAAIAKAFGKRIAEITKKQAQ